MSSDRKEHGSPATSARLRFRKSIVNSINAQLGGGGKDLGPDRDRVRNRDMETEADENPTLPSGSDEVRKSAGQPKSTGSTDTASQSQLLYSQQPAWKYGPSPPLPPKQQDKVRDRVIQTAKPLIRRRSSLFDSLPAVSHGTFEKKPTRSFVRKLSQESTLMNDIDVNVDIGCEDSHSTLLARSQDLPPSTRHCSTATTNAQNGKKKSLFGAVMRRFGSAVASEKSAPATPTRGRSTIGRQSQNEVENETKTESSPALMSPTGNSIMNIVNRFVMNTPFRFQSPGAKRRLQTDGSSSPNNLQFNSTKKSTSNVSTATPSPPRKRRKLDLDPDQQASRSSLHDHDNWEEATIANKQILFLDWSLRTRARIECHPPEWFWMHRSTKNWHDNITYWQYLPSEAPAPPSRLVDSTPSLTGRSGSASASVVKVEQSKLGQDRKGASALGGVPSRILQTVHAARMKQSNFPGPSACEPWKGRQWQEAFRSLFLMYCEKFQSISVDNVQDGLLDCYFYSIGADHAVLFGLTNTKESPFYTPRIIVSSANQTFLDELERLGVESILFLDNRKLEGGKVSALGNSKSAPMSPTLKADLEALRRAQAFGITAGADINVKTNKKASQSFAPNEQKTFPSFAVEGIDDVGLFFESYLNRFGRVSTCSPTGPPRLVCGRLGPFLHATVSKLATYPIALPTGTEASFSADAVDIEGIILPCMIRRLLASLADHIMSQSKLHRANPLDLQSEQPHDTSGGHGSHFVVFHAITEDQSLVPLGLSTSSIFNSWGTCDGKFGSPGQIMECTAGTMLQLLVWEIARSSVVACKLRSILQG